ncbi:hypothetical protein llap_10095 [Limosa lapponica baueri]|uniref:Uncharacterized protein n=1 Tax=Limosa lapponica baueri TaxID=1758121 RepID=A0A2I0U0R2_LIMLA|nr:hypothetical protein llap_10095 [Limosa lapponica baueri]
MGWRGEGKGEPTVGLRSAELPAPIFVILAPLCLCEFSGGIFKDVRCSSQHGSEGLGAEEERAALAEEPFRVEMRAEMLACKNQEKYSTEEFQQGLATFVK